MTRFGDWPSNGVTPIGETYFIVNPNADFGSGANLFGIGSFTMPFAGNLQIEMYAEIYWPGDSTPALWSSVTGSPVPYTADLGVCQPGFNVYRGSQELRTHAWWPGLAAGTVVNGVARLYNNDVTTVHVDYLGGFWRPAPT